MSTINDQNPLEGVIQKPYRDWRPSPKLKKGLTLGVAIASLALLAGVTTLLSSHLATHHFLNAIGNQGIYAMIGIGGGFIALVIMGLYIRHARYSLPSEIKESSETINNNYSVHFRAGNLKKAFCLLKIGSYMVILLKEENGAKQLLYFNPDQEKQGQLRDYLYEQDYTLVGGPLNGVPVADYTSHSNLSNSYSIGDSKE